MELSCGDKNISKRKQATSEPTSGPEEYGKEIGNLGKRKKQFISREKKFEICSAILEGKYNTAQAARTFDIPESTIGDFFKKFKKYVSDNHVTELKDITPKNLSNVFPGGGRPQKYKKGSSNDLVINESKDKIEEKGNSGKKKSIEKMLEKIAPFESFTGRRTISREKKLEICIPIYKKELRIAQASRMYNIPDSTIWDFFKKFKDYVAREKIEKVEDISYDILPDIFPRGRRTRRKISPSNLKNEDYIKIRVKKLKDYFEMCDKINSKEIDLPEAAKTLNVPESRMRGLFEKYMDYKKSNQQKAVDEINIEDIANADIFSEFLDYEMLSIQTHEDSGKKEKIIGESSSDVSKKENIPTRSKRKINSVSRDLKYKICCDIYTKKLRIADMSKQYKIPDSTIWDFFKKFKDFIAKFNIEDVSILSSEKYLSQIFPRSGRKRKESASINSDIKLPIADGGVSFNKDEKDVEQKINVCELSTSTKLTLCLKLYKNEINKEEASKFYNIPENVVNGLFEDFRNLIKRNVDGKVQEEKLTFVFITKDEENIINSKLQELSSLRLAKSFSEEESKENFVKMTPQESTGKRRRKHISREKKFEICKKIFQSKMKVAEAARIYNIPESTIWDFNNKFKSFCRKNAISDVNDLKMEHVRQIFPQGSRHKSTDKESSDINVSDLKSSSVVNVNENENDKCDDIDNENDVDDDIDNGKLKDNIDDKESIGSNLVGKREKKILSPHKKFEVCKLLHTKRTDMGEASRNFNIPSSSVWDFYQKFKQYISENKLEKLDKATLKKLDELSDEEKFKMFSSSSSKTTTPQENKGNVSVDNENIVLPPANEENGSIHIEKIVLKPANEEDKHENENSLGSKRRMNVLSNEKKFEICKVMHSNRESIAETSRNSNIPDSTLRDIYRKFQDFIQINGSEILENPSKEVINSIFPNVGRPKKN